MDCQFGTHYYKQKQGSSKRTHLQVTRKIGCTARVTVYSITLYPDFHVSKKKTSDLSCRRLKQKKKEKLCKLRDVTSKGKPLSSIMKYYIILPGEEAHHEYHETHGAASYAQRIHPKLIEQIYELVGEGTTEVQEVKRALKHYVQHSLCADVKPDLTDRAYYPTSTDVHNHIYLAQCACQLSKLDQDLQLKVQKWKRDSPNSKFYFRPYKESTKDSEIDTVDPTLLYIHQEPWQQQLMVKYGNTISLMDATYNELALFLLQLRGDRTIFFFLVLLEKKIITNSYFIFFYVYMSKCRQFKGLSTGMSKLTIPNHTIKLQLHCRGTSSFLEEKK